MAMSKEAWIDAIKLKLDENGNAEGVFDEITMVALKSMTVRQLFIVETLVAWVREDSCSVGCGGCEFCNACNERADAAFKARAAEGK